MTQAMSPQNNIAQNLAARRALLATSSRFRKALGTYTGTVGGTTRVKMDNVGILTGIMLRVYGTYTIGTADVTASEAAPYNVIRRLKFNDFDGSDRIDVSGHHLWLINSQRERRPWGDQNVAGGPGSVVTLPKAELATGSSKAYEFLLYVPIAYNAESDLRGAILAQTTRGELTLSIDWASDAQWLTDGLDDAVFNGAATSTIASQTINVDVVQDYLVARDLGNGQLPLPLLDLMTVYELRGSLRSSDNLAANSAKYIDVPNVRSVVGATLTYLNNGVYTQSDLDKIQLVANSTNVVYEASNSVQFTEQRRWVGGDLGKSAYFLNFRAKPIETAQIGNAQLWFTPAAFTSSSNSWVETTWEQLYPKGSTLPGIQQ